MLEGFLRFELKNRITSASRESFAIRSIIY